MNIGTRKLIWSVPLVAVLAVAGALAIFAAQMPGTALAHDPPGVVGNLMGEADGQNQIDLSWDAPAMGGTPTSYRIDRSINGNTWMTHVTDHTMRTYSDMGLDSGSTYYYRVFAVNSAGTGPVSQDFLVQTDVGDATSGVIQLRATAMGQNQINLTWMAPAELNGSPVEKYWIHFGSGDAPSIPAQTEDADNPGVIEVAAEDGMSYEHKELTAATRYSYIVYAENDTGKSTVPSNTAGATTAVLVKPGAPAGLVASQGSGGVFNLYWHAPAITGGVDPIEYDIEVSYNGRSFIDVPAAALTTAFSATAGTVSADAVVTVTGNVPDVTPETPITRVAFRVYAVTRPNDTGTVGIDEELKSDGYASTRSVDIIADEDVPNLVPAAPGFAAADAVRDSKGSVNLTWTAPGIDSSTEAADDLPDSIGGYRIDVSDDGINWRGLVHHTRKTATKYEYADTEKKNRSYRIFAWHGQYLGPAQEPVVESELETATVVSPDHVSAFTATAVGPSQIDLAWKAPANDGGADISRYIIAGARQAAGAFADFPTEAPADDATGLLYATSKTTGYMHKKLNAGETWQYRVLVETDDESETDNLRTSPAGSAETRTATTPQASLPEAPESLTAEDAKDSSLAGTANRGVLLLWNAPNPPDGANIDGYRVERKKGAAAWETLAMDTNNTFTDYTDTSEPATGELRAYRVAALNGSKAGAWAMVYYPHALAQPGKPTLTAAKDADMPGTKVKLTWTAPDMNADLVTGYIIERRHAGDMMGDILSDGYNAGVMGASHAFMDYKEWWETLNCKGMLAVAGSSASDTATEGESAQDIADRGMYCKHFDSTAPTSMDFPAAKEISEATAMKVKDLFMKRYVTDDMGKTMTMFTGMMYTDMGLMANTEYTYRVRAIHGMKAGMWSDKAMVTTTTDNTDPMKVGTIGAVTVEVGETSDPMDVSVNFSDTDGDTLTYTAISSADMTATADIPAGSSMLTITGVAEGSATITVTASDGKSGTDAIQTIAVTVTPGTLTPPTNVRVEQSGNMVTIHWDGGENADTFTVAMLARKADGSWDIPNAVYDQNLSGSPHMVNMATRPAGTYIVGVAAGTDDGEWSDWVTSTPPLEYAP